MYSTLTPKEKIIESQEILDKYNLDVDPCLWNSHVYVFIPNSIYFHPEDLEDLIELGWKIEAKYSDGIVILLQVHKYDQ